VSHDPWNQRISSINVRPSETIKYVAEAAAQDEPALPPLEEQQSRRLGRSLSGASCFVRQLAEPS
jgi:hypothetical protein